MSFAARVRDGGMERWIEQLVFPQRDTHPSLRLAIYCISSWSQVRVTERPIWLSILIIFGHAV